MEEPQRFGPELSPPATIWPEPKDCQSGNRRMGTADFTDLEQIKGVLAHARLPVWKLGGLEVPQKVKSHPSPRRGGPASPASPESPDWLIGMP